VENVIKVECNVATWYGYSGLCTSRDFLINIETKMFPDRILTDIIVAENVIKAECDVATQHGYPRLQTTPHDSLINIQMKIPPVKFFLTQILVDNAIIKLNVIWEHGMDIHTNVCHHAIC
jgi:hypothetical protein